MSTVFYLIVTFYTYGANYAGQLESTTLPATYATKADCDAAGAAAHDNFNGGAKVEWTCVPCRKRGRRMSETAHTKTPWAIGHTGARIIAPALPGFNGSPFRVADANSSALVHSASFEEAKANAAFIVRAVNAHGPLVAALRDVRGHFKTEMAPDGRVMSISHDSEALPKVIAALDAALSLAESSP